VPEIQEIIGADRLIYLDLHGLIRSVRHDNSEIREFDTSCFSGIYVTGEVTDDYLKNLEKVRSDQAKAKRELRLHSKGSENASTESGMSTSLPDSAVGM